jgi:hypothetical protein
MGMMSHNYRIYGTALLLIQMMIVALGVKFVQLLAPISLGKQPFAQLPLINLLQLVLLLHCWLVMQEGSKRR